MGQKPHDGQKAMEVAGDVLGFKAETPLGRGPDFKEGLLLDDAPIPDPDMLKGIDPRLGPDLLRILRAMGHGDEIAVVDANFPAEASAQRLYRDETIDVVAMVRAIASVLPLDDFSPSAAFCMAVVDAPETTPPVVAELGSALAEVGYRGEIVALERQVFYDRARAAFCIVATGERRLYGNLILTKGVIRPAA